jgi:hypothetical protein
MRRVRNRNTPRGSGLRPSVRLAFRLLVAWVLFELLAGGLMHAGIDWGLGWIAGPRVRPEVALHPHDLVLITATLAFARLSDLHTRPHRPSSSWAWLSIALALLAITCTQLGAEVKFQSESRPALLDSGHLWAVALPLSAVGLILCVFAFFVVAREEVGDVAVLSFDNAVGGGPAKRSIGSGQESAQSPTSPTSERKPGSQNANPTDRRERAAWPIVGAALLALWVFVRRLRRP